MHKYLKLIPLVFIFAFIIYSAIGFFRIRKATIISETKDINGLNILNNQNYLVVNEKEIENHILGRNVYLASFSVKKLFPDKLQMSAVWRKPAVNLSLGDRNFPVDAFGMPAKSDHNIKGVLPEIILPNLQTNSGSPDWRVLKILRLMSNLDKYGLQLTDISVSSDSALVNALIVPDTEIALSLEKDPFEAAASLQTIIARFRIEGKIVSRIDYRFDKPVVVLKNE